MTSAAMPDMLAERVVLTTISEAVGIFPTATCSTPKETVKKRHRATARLRGCMPWLAWVETALKAYQPVQRIRAPIVAMTVEWPGIRLTVPSGLKRP